MIAAAPVPALVARLAPLLGPEVAEERARNIACACLGAEPERATEIADEALSRRIPTIQELAASRPIDEHERVLATFDVAEIVAAHLRGECS